MTTEKIEVKQENTSPKSRKTALVAQTELYTNMLIKSFQEMSIDYTEYKKICMINVLSKMKDMLAQRGKDFKDIDQTNIVSILTRVAMLELNIAASPAECFLQFRNEKQEDGSTKLKFEFGIEGNGNDALLRNFGSNVKDINLCFIVREGDEFTYPHFDGEKMVAPTWTPKSYCSKPIKVVYIIEKNNGNKEYLISEREEVVKNLQAHITNNMMSVPDDVKNGVISKISNMTLEAILNDESLRTLTYQHYNNYTKKTEQKTIKLISPAWINPQSREDMIIRKMKNNATKKYPKDFKNSFTESAYKSTFEDYDQYREKSEDAIDVEEKVQEEINQKLVSQKIENINIKEDQESVEKNKDIVSDECPI